MTAGATYRFRLRVDMVWRDGASVGAAASVDVTTAECPSMGTVLVQPMVGVASVTRFNMSANGWSGGGPDAEALQYKFVALGSGEGPPVALSDFGPSSLLSALLLPMTLADGDGVVDRKSVV